MQPGPVTTPAEDALARREAELLADARHDAVHELLLDAAVRHPDAAAGAALAVRAAGHASEHLEPSAAAEAYALALRLDPACEDAVSGWCRQAWEARDWETVAALLVRLGMLAVAPADRAERLATAGDVWDERLGRTDRARGCWLRALRAFPPAAAASAEARRVFVASGRIARLLPLLAERVEEAVGRGDDLARAEAHLARGRLQAADPARRDAAVADLVEAAAHPSGPGSVALLVLGGLHGAGEGWVDLVDLLEAEADVQAGTDGRAAANVLRRVARACLSEPPAFARAERVLRRLVALDPEDAGSAEALVGVLGAGGRHREAVELLRDLARIGAPSTAALYLMRAGVMELARFGDRAASLRCFEEALARHPASRAAATHLEEAYAEAGRWADLARVKLAQVEGRPVDAEVLDTFREAGRILRDRAGDVVAAAEIYKRIVAHDPMDDDAVAFFEDFHRRIEAESTAVDAHARAAEQARSTDDRLQSLLQAAESALRLGSPPRARSFLEAARAEAPDDREVRERLFGLLETWGDHRALADTLTTERARLGPDHGEWGALTLRLASVHLDHLGELEPGRALLEALADAEVAETDAARDRLAALRRSLEAAHREAPVAAGEAVRSALRHAVPGDDGLDAAGAEATVGLPGEVPGAPEDDRGQPAGTDAAQDAPPAPPDAEQAGALLTRAREALAAGAFEEALLLAEEIESSWPASTPQGRDARELAADLLIDHLDDAAEGLDRLAALGRDRSLPIALRRRVSEARVRILERDLPSTGERDLALAEALADAAAVADGAEAARAFQYRRARLLAARPEHAQVAAGILQGLLLDAPDSGAVLELLASLHQGQRDWSALATVLERQAELLPPEEAASVYGRLADVCSVDLGDPGRGMRHLQRALERLPGHLPTLKTLARMARDAGDLELESFALRGRIAVEREHDALPALHYALAESLEGLGRPKEAVVHYRRALESDPRSLSAHHGLVRAAESADDPEALVEALAGAASATRDPHEVAGLHARRGRILLERLADPDRARSAVQEALRHDLEHPEAISLLRDLETRSGASPGDIARLLRREAEATPEPALRAERLVEAGRILAGPGRDPEAGRGCFEAALAQAPDHPVALSGLARVLLESETPAEARPHLQRILASEAPDAARAWAAAALGALLEDEGSYGEAFDRYAEAADLDPDDARAQLGLGVMGIKVGRLDDAARALAAAADLGGRGVEGAPREAELTETLARLGAVRRRLGQSREAIRAFRLVLERDPVHRGALTALAVLLETESDWQGAAEMRERAAMLIPDPGLRAGALAAVGAFLRDRADDPRRALELFGKAVALDPDDLATRSATLALARRLGRHEQARDAALACARMAPSSAEGAEYLCAASEAARLQGDAEAALSLLRSALDQDPGSVPAVQASVELLAEGGGHAEAVAILKRAITFARGEDQRLSWTLLLARLLQDAGDVAAAAAVLADAAARHPADRALLMSLADGPAPPRQAALPALEVVSAGLPEQPLDRARLLAAENLATGAGDTDRAFLHGSLLELLRAAPAAVRERVARRRAQAPGRPLRPLESGLMDLLLPKPLLEGARFYAEVEAALLALPQDRRPFPWPDVPLGPVPAEWSTDSRELSRLLGLPVMGIGSTPAGSGVQVLPERERLGVAAELLEDRSEAERRFVLVFGLALSVPGRRWVTATGDVVAALDHVLNWTRGVAPDEVALEQGERFGLGLHRTLRELVHDRVPSAAEWVEAAVVGAARVALAASADPAAALPAALRLLEPGRELPDTADALEAALLVNPVLSGLLAFLHSATFLEVRRALGLG